MADDSNSRSDDFARDIELVARVSHELRSPLTAVMGMLDVVLDPALPLDEAESAELLDLARHEADQMQHLVDNLLSYARLQRSSLDPSAEPVSLRSTIERALARHEEVRRRAFVSIPSEAGALADPNLVLQIITNLLQNIDRYAPLGAVEIEVTIGSTHAAVSMSDEGPGVSPSLHEKIFETQTESSMGLGMGLELSRELALSMGGDLRLDASRRGGATFTLSLPVAEVENGHLDNRRQSSISSTPRARLLVDMAAALAETSLDQAIAGLQSIYSDILGATSAVLMVPDGDERFRALGGFAATEKVEAPQTDPLLARVLASRLPVLCKSLRECDPHWADKLDVEAGLFIPVFRGDEVAGVLVLGWITADLMPDGSVEIAESLGTIAAAALDRSNLADEVAFERSVRESVMEALPIAISVFVGDPPKLVYWNQRERQLLGVDHDDDRPMALSASQELFEVAFADGTPLTLENAPVVETIRTGRSTGPFFLRICRLEGRSVCARTYCAPFFDGAGKVAGAVVTSEEVDSNAVLSPTAIR